MTQGKVIEGAILVKLLCVVTAGLLWLSVAMERPGEAKLVVPITLRLPAGMQLDAPAPANVDVTVTGPKILLLLLPYRDMSCNIDLHGAAAGTANIALRDAFSSLPDKELKVVQVFPASLKLDLAPAAPR